MFNVNNFYSGTTFLNLSFPLKIIFIVQHDRYTEKVTHMTVADQQRLRWRIFRKLTKEYFQEKCPLWEERKQDGAEEVDL